ncbi:MAG: RNA polymerase sigma factor, partial [Chitinophagia bacterium]|nr:RNA polymerase sigma factor [Chitinophagia bacterium]
MPEAIAPTDDGALIASFKVERSRDQAFTALVAKYQERLYWHIRKMVVQHDDTHDILQNVFIKVWRHLGDFREEASLFTWLYRIATNETLSWLEQQKKRRMIEGGGSAELLADTIAAQKDFDPTQIEWKLQQAIATLPDKQRLVFNLRYYDELSYSDMSEILQTSEGALKASYHHAVK